jgi:heptosyltransferase-2
LAVLFPNSFNAALVVFLARIPRRFGYAADGRSLLLTDTVAPPSQSKQMHQVKYYEEFIRSICPAYSSTPPLLKVSIDDEVQANKLLASHAVSEDVVLLGLNPGAVYGGAKQWLPERFAGAADQIVQNIATDRIHADHVRCVIVGAPGEETLGLYVAGLMRTRPVVLSGKTSLGELKAVIQRCRLFLTNDTGPMHIANALGTPVVAVFGPTNHTTTSPYGEDHILVRTSVDCSPCMLRECPIDHKCMTGVTVEQVVRAAEQVLAERESSPPRKIWFNP